MVPEAVMDALTSNVAALLTSARQMGSVFIITNGEEGWVEHCIHNYMPKLVPVVKGIPVISARSLYETLYPLKQWKVQAFLALQKTFFTEPITSFVSIGDSILEKEAARITGQVFPNAVVKTVKFVENPSPRELSRQLQLVGEKLQKVVECGKKLDISLEKKDPTPKEERKGQRAVEEVDFLV